MLRFFGRFSVSFQVCFLCDFYRFIVSLFRSVESSKGRCRNENDSAVGIFFQVIKDSVVANRADVGAVVALINDDQLGRAAFEVGLNVVFKAVEVCDDRILGGL